MKYILIANPVSGGGSSSRIDTIQDYFESRGHSLEVRLTQKRGDAEQYASEYTGADDVGDVVVIAAGGDGTLNEVINGIYPSKTPVAFIPLGTTNVFAIETGISFALETACEQILTGVVQNVSVGESNSRKFILMLGFGLDAEAVRSVSIPIKRFTGKLAYAISGLKAFLFYQIPETTVRFDDGETITGYGGVISNCACYGGPFKVSPSASLSNKSLELVLFKKRSKLAMLVNALKVGSGVGLSDRDAWQKRFTGAKVTGQGLPFQIDGDEYTDEDQEVRVLPEWLRMVLPEK